MSDSKLMLKEYVKDKLSEILEFRVPDEMVDEMLLKNDRDLEAHLKDLLGTKNPKTKPFIAEFIKRRKTVNIEPVQKKKYDDDDKYKLKSNKNAIKSDTNISFESSKKANAPTEKSPKGSASTTNTSKKKNKFVNFYAKDGETVLLKGRYLCNCEAKKHTLINNCLQCGRIVCEQEGSGPCFVCDTLVCTVEEQMIFSGDTGKATKLYEQLLTKEKPKVQKEEQKGLEEAINQRNKLLEFDRNTKKHTHVFDDDSDYYCSVNPWLTLEERDKCKKMEEEFFNKKNQSRMEKKIILEVGQGGKVTEVEEKNVPNRITDKDINKSSQSTSNVVQPRKLDSIDNLLDPFFTSFKPTFKGRLRSQKSAQSRDIMDYTTSHILDTGLRQMTDEGHCLSIHQPWASFLVNGIRKFEGRTWYTPYRGKLWIASTGVKLSRQDAVKYENMYRLIVGDIKFPADYPSSALIGSVDLVDCLTQEQYRSEYPNGELEDAYVFICENPQPLPIRYPMKGKPNIYKLDDKVHTAAKNCLKTMAKLISESQNKVKSFRP